MTDDLASWLLEQIAEDERVARASYPYARWWVDGPAERSGEWWVYDAGAKCKRREDAEHIAAHDPARVLAECEAQRRIVELHRIDIDICDACDKLVNPAIGCETLRLLALPYADRDGYKDDWRP